MKNVKFWLVQIAMVAILSLVFGSPAFADRPDHAYQSDNASDMGKSKANVNATGEVLVDEGETGGDNTSGDGEGEGDGEAEECVPTFSTPCP